MEFVRKFRLMDDVFMTAYFKDNIPCAHGNQFTESLRYVLM